MEDKILWTPVHFLFFLFSISLLILNFSELKQKKKLIGTIRYRWSPNFNIEFPLNWLKWIMVLCYLIWSFYLILRGPKDSTDFTPFTMFFLFLSFYPTWHVFVGSEGIVIERKVILWKMVTERKIIEKGRIKYLEIRWVYPSEPAKIRSKRIPIPSKGIKFIQI